MDSYIAELLTASDKYFTYSVNTVPKVPSYVGVAG